MRKKFAIVISFSMFAAIGVAYASTWSLPGTRSFYSENKMFVARVTPAKKQAQALLEAFQVSNSENLPLWQCPLGNDFSPAYVFISDEGKYVATVDEWGTNARGGIGDYVVAFYNKEGVYKNYSLEQILHYPERITKTEFRRLTWGSCSSKFWAGQPMFLDKYHNATFLCLWLRRGERWLAWDVATGNEVNIDNKMTQSWNEKGRLWALNRGVNSKYSYRPACEFLTNLHRLDDRPVVESLLDDTDFRTHTSYASGWRPGKTMQVTAYNAKSAKRAFAHKLLANWDPNSPGKHYLGEIEGLIQLPQEPKPGDGRLYVYLIPVTTTAEDSYSELPVHRLAVDFRKSSFRGRWLASDMPFAIKTVTAGSYRVKAVWDKGEPHTFSDKGIKGPPQKGDYQNSHPPVITVVAGQTVKDITVDCTHEPAGGAD